MRVFINKIFIFWLLFVIFIISGFGCKTTSKEVKQKMKPITLKYWRVFDGPDAFDEIIKNYKKLHPFINIEYRKLRYEEYEQELLDALAEDRGPDIFTIGNTWIRKYQKKLAPMPDNISMVYPVEKGTLKKEIVPELRTTKSISLREIKNSFVDTVYDDVVILVRDEQTKNIKSQVYGLPLALDTLAMFYNKDLMNIAGISEVPQFWDKIFQDSVKKLTKQDDKGQIIQSGISLGGSYNIRRAPDILAVLMMQNGAEMVTDGNLVFFNRIPKRMSEANYNPGLDALRFYTDFSNPAKEIYTWNSQLDNSLKMFTEGRLAFTFGYSYDVPIIKSLAPKLNFGIAKLPQIEGNTTINYANYWVEVVSVKSKYINESWDFVQFATKAEQAKVYLAVTKKPTALRSLVSSQIDDIDIGVFAEQVLTAKSWYRGLNVFAMEKIFNDMIDAANKGEKKLEEILNIGAQQVQQTMGTEN